MRATAIQQLKPGDISEQVITGLEAGIAYLNRSIRGGAPRQYPNVFGTETRNAIGMSRATTIISTRNRLTPSVTTRIMEMVVPEICLTWLLRCQSGSTYICEISSGV